MTEPNVPASALVIRGGRLIDGTGAAPIEDAVVVVEGPTIRSVGRGDEIFCEVPEGAQVIDARGKTIMPGLIDSHLHFWGLKTDHGLTDQFFRPLEVNVIKAVKDARDLLEAGFTTARCLGGLPAVMLRLAKAEGSLDGIPRIIAAGHPLSQTSTHGDAGFPPAACSNAESMVHPPVVPGGNLIFDGVDGAVKAVRQAVKTGSDFIKIMGLVEVMGPAAADLPIDDFDLDEIEAVVRAATQAGLPVSAHAIDPREAKRAVLAGVKTIEHVVGVDNELLELAAKHDVTVVSTLSTFSILKDHPGQALLIPFEWSLDKESAGAMWPFMFQQACESCRRVREAGVRLAAGTDFMGNPLMAMGTNAMELEILVNHCGFSPMEAITAATKNGARACFVDAITGTLEAGKSADLIVVGCDPLDDISVLRNKENMRLVMLEGRVEVDRGL